MRPDSWLPGDEIESELRIKRVRFVTVTRLSQFSSRLGSKGKPIASRGLVKTKRPPEGGLSVALIRAESQATRTPPPADLVTQPLWIIYTVPPPACESKGIVPPKRPNKCCSGDTRTKLLS